MSSRTPLTMHLRRTASCDSVAESTSGIRSDIRSDIGHSNAGHPLPRDLFLPTLKTCTYIVGVEFPKKREDHHGFSSKDKLDKSRARGRPRDRRDIDGGCAGSA